MTLPTGKSKTKRQDREAVRQALASPAWRLWMQLSRGDVMAAEDDREPMLERHKIVVAIIELNSQQLRCDSQAAGLDVERLTAERDAEQLGDTPETRQALADIAKRTAEIEEKFAKLKVEREWLEKSLEEFDANLPPEKPELKGHA